MFFSLILKALITGKQLWNWAAFFQTIYRASFRKIEVQSFQGTEIIITLFKGNKHFNEDQIIKEPDVIEASLLQKEPYIFAETEILKTTNEGESRYTLLLIEDNRDLSQFLKNKLQKEFDIIISDGTDAIESLRNDTRHYHL